MRRVVWIALVAVVAVSAFWIARDRFSDASDDATPAAPRAVVAYSSNGDIFVIRSGGEGPEQLTVTPEQELSPALSPDGRTIVFERIEGPDSATIWGLHSISVEGGAPVRLTTGQRESGYDRFPAWSPDGAHIAFVRHVAKGSEILGTDAAVAVMNADGSDQREVTERPGSAAHPAWSHDGEAVFFDMARAGSAWIARVEIDTGDLEVLAEGFNPQPSGDGVAFLRTIRPLVVDAFEMPLAGGDARRLTRGRELWGLVSFAGDGLAAAEGGEAGAPGSMSRIVVLRGRSPWGSLDDVVGLGGFSVSSER